MQILWVALPGLGLSNASKHHKVIVDFLSLYIYENIRNGSG
ncbi:hypothetical protein l11_01190 [Neisseria weaveri LMG 5135]|nr:hypothetical protein l13_06400 [Neisseria weaveri ATCC 51223]EGV38672.1 hypothetical protein l11_01190 [Neisseria weaveri LMG 5135]